MKIKGDNRYALTPILVEVRPGDESLGLTEHLDRLRWVITALGQRRVLAVMNHILGDGTVNRQMLESWYRIEGGQRVLPSARNFFALTLALKELEQLALSEMKKLERKRQAVQEQRLAHKPHSYLIRRTYSINEHARTKKEQE